VKRREIAHILTITEDGEDWDWAVRCPYEGQWATDDRPCGTYLQCDHTMTEDERDKLAEDGEGPCPTSKTGQHIYLDCYAHQPTKSCWVTEYDGTCEQVDDIHESHGPGTYAVRAFCSYDEIDIEVHARIDPTAGEGQR
jgi:hypothetical protein